MKVTLNKKPKVYFASPWFNDEQLEREERVKAKLRELEFEVWSPKENCVCPPDAGPIIRKKVFDENVFNILDSEVIFVITDGKDMGTIWEAGFAYCTKTYNSILSLKKKTIIYYCETLEKDGQFNLMLAQSGDIIITKFEDLDNLYELIKEGKQIEYAGPIE